MKISSQQTFVSHIPFEVSIFVPSQEQWQIVPPENPNILVTPIAGTGSMEVKVKVVGTAPARQQYITFSDIHGSQTFCLVFADELIDEIATPPAPTERVLSVVGSDRFAITPTTVGLEQEDVIAVIYPTDLSARATSCTVTIGGVAYPVSDFSRGFEIDFTKLNAKGIVTGDVVVSVQVADSTENKVDDLTQWGVIWKIDPNNNDHFWVYSTRKADPKVVWQTPVKVLGISSSSNGYANTKAVLDSQEYATSPQTLPLFQWVSSLGDGWYIGSPAEWDTLWENVTGQVKGNSAWPSAWAAHQDVLSEQGADTLYAGNDPWWTSQEYTNGSNNSAYTSYLTSFRNNMVAFAPKTNAAVNARAFAEIRNNVVVVPVDPYSVGQIYPEGGQGVIWKVDPLNKRHCWVYSKTQSAAIKWCASATLTVPDLNSSATDGYENTKTVSAITGRPAVEWVKTLGDGWYVGASAEWKELWLNLTENPFDSFGSLAKFNSIMDALEAKGVPTLDTSTAFWCSDEVLVTPNYSERVSDLSGYRNGSSNQSATKTNNQITIGFAEVEDGFIVVPQPDIEIEV